MGLSNEYRRRVLGFDPGTATTGYGVVEVSGGEYRMLAGGVIRTAPGQAMVTRLLGIHRKAEELIRTHAPDRVAVESIFPNRNVTQAVALGQARGVLLLAAGGMGLPVREYTPQEVKQAVTGYGAAGKGQVQRMVAGLLGLAEVPRPDDAADALAVAICSLQRAAMEEVVS